MILEYLSSSDYICTMSIEVEKITKKYGQQLALKELSFKIQTGEIVGFLGPNGAGKSTLMKIVTGFLSSDSGIARVCGLKVQSNKIDFRSKIGYLPEQNPLYPEMYIREYLAMVAGMYKLKDKKKQIEHVIEITGLRPEVSKKIGALSKGYRQRVGIAQALIHNPEVLILDEPTSGLDPNQLDDIRNLITGISKDKTVILSTHIMQEVEAICNRVIILKRGEIVADGNTSEIKNMAEGKGQQVYFSTVEKLSVKNFTSIPFISSVEEIKPNEFLVSSLINEDIRPLLFQLAVSKSWNLKTLSEVKHSVENIFRELTQ